MKIRCRHCGFRADARHFGSDGLCRGYVECCHRYSQRRTSKMGLIILLLVLVILTGGVGFSGEVALGSLALLVKILFAVLLVSLLVSVVRQLTYTGDPYL